MRVRASSFRRFVGPQVSCCCGLAHHARRDDIVVGKGDIVISSSKYLHGHLEDSQSTYFVYTAQDRTVSSIDLCTIVTSHHMTRLLYRVIIP